MAKITFENGVKPKKQLYEGRYHVVIKSSTEKIDAQTGKTMMLFEVEHEGSTVYNLIKYYTYTPEGRKYFQQEMSNILGMPIDPGTFDTDVMNGVACDLVVFRNENDNRLKPTKPDTEEEELAI